MSADSASHSLGPYELVAQIGRGRNARVYRATHTASGDVVAIKLFSPKRLAGSGNAAAFQKMIASVRRLDHPHILPLLDTGSHEGYTYLVTPYVARHGLDAWLKQAGTIDPDQALAILEQAGAALDAAHRAGITHGSIQPSNLLIAEDGAILVSDFGQSAVFQHKERTPDGDTMFVVGSPAYMAPELALTGTPSEASDIYALGVLLFEMLTGQHPYQGDDPADVIRQHRHAAIPRASDARPALPASVDGVIARALAKSPQDRPKTAGDLIDSLRNALHLQDETRAAMAALLKGAEERGEVVESYDIDMPIDEEGPVFAGIPRWVLMMVGGAAAMLALLILLVAGRAVYAAVTSPIIITATPQPTRLANLAIPTDIVTSEGAASPSPYIYPTLVPTPTTRPTYTPWPSHTPVTPDAPTQAATLPPRGGSGGTGGSTGAQLVTAAPGPTYQPGAVFTLGVIVPQTPGAPPSPSSNAVIFSRDGQIYAVSSDGSGVMQLTNAGGRNFQPSRGGQVAFTSDRDGNQEIYLMGLNGTGQARLTADGAADNEPSWSAEGLIAFSSSRSGGTDIYVMRADGAILGQAASGDAQDRMPNWSPNGQQIVFASNRDGGDYDLFIANKDGTGLTQITANVFDELDPSWSPDGGRIVYVGGGNVHVIDIASRASFQLTKIGGVQSVSWSPDGAQVAFSAYGDIYITGVTSGSPVRITSGGSNDTDPAWVR